MPSTIEYPLTKDVAALQSAIYSGVHVVAWAGALGAWGSLGLANCSIVESAYAGQWSSRCASYPGGTAVTVASKLVVHSCFAWVLKQFSMHCVSLDSSSWICAAPSGNTTVAEPASFVACTLLCRDGSTASPLAWVGATPVAWAVSAGPNGGSLTVFGSPFGAPSEATPVSDPGVDATLPSPYPLLGHIAFILDDCERVW